MTCITLQQITSKQATQNKLSGLSIPKNRDFIERFMTPEKFKTFNKHFTESKIYLWGAKTSSADAWANMLDGKTLVLFRESNKVVLRGVSVYKMLNEELAEELWGRDESDSETWKLIYFMNKIQKVEMSVREVNEHFGYVSDYNWQRLNTVRGEKAESFVPTFLDELREPRF